MSIWYLYFNFHTFLSIVNFYIISISAIHVPHRFNDLGLALCPAVLEGRQQGKPGGAQEMGGEVLVEKARDSSSSNEFDISWHFVTFERQLFLKRLLHDLLFQAEAEDHQLFEARGARVLLLLRLPQPRGQAGVHLQLPEDEILFQV